jgi:hypothetical protein
MTSLLDWGSGGDTAPLISELILDREPRLILLFTDAMEEVDLHYVADPTVRRYAVCPGVGCPLCGLGGAPTKFALLPVYDLENSQVRALRVSSTRGPSSLRSVLVRHLTDPDIASKVVLLRRDGNSYTAESRPLAASADRGQQVIAAFLADQGEGLQLRSAFWQPQPTELREVPTIRTKLEAVDGLPSNDSEQVPF